MNPATRKFINEFGNTIGIIVIAGRPGQDVSSRVGMRGPSSEIESNMTRQELENMRDAIIEALAEQPS